jgi:diguanylate cyclase (GGDEF)-like protein/PAS domain S-box-containing protein
MKEIQRNRWLTPLAAALNLGALLVVGLVYQEIKRLDDTWQEAAGTELRDATLLTELERKLGYSGFIHHFKNYVLRREAHNAESATQAYERATGLVLELSRSQLGRQHPDQIHVLETTLSSYHEALELSLDRASASLTPAQLDRLVRVSDDAAAEALAELRVAAGKLSLSVTTMTEEKVAQLRKNLLLAAGILSPLILALTVFLQKSLYRSWQIAERYKRLHVGSPDGILLCNSSGQIVEASPAACQLFGYSQEEMFELTVEALVPASMRRAHVQQRVAFAKDLQSRPMGQGAGPLKGIRKDGGEVTIQISLASQDIEGERHVMAIVRDVSHTERLRSESNTDHLTRILNRRGFETVLSQELERNTRYRHGLALLLIDLDRFKEVNDSLGHATGDMVLQKTSEFLREQCRTSDHVGRWGGDEFVVLCPEASFDEVSLLGNRLAREFARRSSAEFHGTTLSIGVTCIAPGTDSSSSEELVAAADVALYTSKQQGRAQVQFS